MFWSLFNTFTGPGMIWRKMMIGMHFGDKMRGSSKLTIEPLRVDIQSPPSIDAHSVPSIDSKARKAKPA